MNRIDPATARELRRRLHDISNALNAILMQAELVRLYTNGGTPADDVAAALETISNECRSAGALCRGSGELVTRLSE
ncbi:MAG: hypothetical protein AAFX58_01345 [Pseudomonadota bacterium]